MFWTRFVLQLLHMIDSYCRAAFRVVRFRYRANRNKPVDMREQNKNTGMYRGPFTQQLTAEILAGVKLGKPYELRFHSLLGQRKLFVSRCTVLLILFCIL